MQDKPHEASDTASSERQNLVSLFDLLAMHVVTVYAGSRMEILMLSQRYHVLGLMGNMPLHQVSRTKLIKDIANGRSPLHFSTMQPTSILFPAGSKMNAA